MHDLRSNPASGLLVALLFSFTAVLAAPLTVQITNQFEFVFTSFDLFKALLPAFVLCVVGLTALLALLRGNTYQVVLSVLFMVSLLLWIQGNILVWDYGALDGRDIDWLAMWPFGVLDGGLWLAGLGLSIRYSGWISRNLIGSASVIVILAQCVGLYSGLANSAPVEKYNSSYKGRFVFSNTTNVVVIVVDAFQTDVFQELIDEDPALEEVFDGFVYFRNAVSGFRQSYPSIPNILTATYFDNSQPMWDYLRAAYLSDSSLPKFFRDHGYRSEVYEQKKGMYFDPAVVTNVSLSSDFAEASSDVLRVIDVSLFRSLPHFLKRLVYNNQLWLLSRWFPPRISRPDQSDEATMAAENTRADYIDLNKRPAKLYFSDDNLAKLSNLRYVNAFVDHSRVGFEQPVFKFFHLIGTHLPIRMNREFEYVEPKRSRAALKELSIGVIRLIDLILESFRELGILDDALIVVTADHGMWTSIAEVKIPDQILQLHGENGSVSAEFLPERKGTVLPLVLIKRVGARGEMLTNDAPVSLSDIPRTVVSEMGLDASSFPGESMFEVKENQRRKRKVFYSTFKENPPYTHPYRSTMTEFEVDGFSWLDKSWTKTGRSYPDPGE